MKEKSVNEVTKRRKKYWIINALLFYLLKLNPFRDKNLWIFGCWEGMRYDDNSKYLFEYVNKTHPEINAIWMTANPDVVKYVRARGYQAVMADSVEGKKIQLKAGKVFYTNGLDDFGNICYFYGAEITALWHGVGIKKIYYNRKKDKDYKYFLKVLKDKIFSWVYRDYTISTSKEANEFFKSTFNIGEEGIIITGQPRNDILRRRIDPADVLKNVVDADEYKYILYMPTHRPYPDTTIADTIRLLSEDEVFLKYLHENRFKLLLKLHYLTRLDGIQLPKEIIILNNEDVSSSQELLAISELLITDYSSCIIDFAITQRKSILFTPDYQKYCEEIGILDPWPELYMNFSIKNINDLRDKIIELLENLDIKENVTSIINRIYEDQKITGTCYSENICRFLLSK